ncbi:unnamed protein product [Cercospora beticola]|nr:unnamed protein product [Cercospora beticola]
MGIWNAMSLDEEHVQELPFYAALMRHSSDFLVPCTLRAWEYSWISGYHGPCGVSKMLELWEGVDQYVTLPFRYRLLPIMDKSKTVKQDVDFCFILPPTVLCPECGKPHLRFRVVFILQIGLQRLTQDKLDDMARDWTRKGNKDQFKATVSHLQGDAQCRHVLHYEIESAKLKTERAVCSNNGRCSAHGDTASQCLFPQPDPKTSIVSKTESLRPCLLPYNKIIWQFHDCPHPGCNTRLCWPELYSRYVSSHIDKEVLPTYQHSGLYRPCPGCPFGLATASLSKGAEYMWTSGDAGKQLQDTYKHTECQRYVHHVASYFFFEDATCAPWRGPYYVQQEGMDSLAETVADGTVGMVGMQPKDAFISAWRLPADWYQASSMFFHRIYTPLDALSWGWTLHCHNKDIAWMIRKGHLPENKRDLDKLCRDKMKMYTRAERRRDQIWLSRRGPNRQNEAHLHSAQRPFPGLVIAVSQQSHHAASQREGSYARQRRPRGSKPPTEALESSSVGWMFSSSSRFECIVHSMYLVFALLITAMQPSKLQTCQTSQRQRESLSRAMNPICAPS